MTVEQFNAMVIVQNNVCAICGKPETRILDGRFHPLSVDHDHVTGKIRALLCGKCNRAIGFFNESSRQLRKAADYLDYHKR